MREGLRLMDADRHVLEPPGLWRDYLPPEYREGAPYYQVLAPQESLEQRVARLGPKGLLPPMETLMLDGQPVWNKLSERAMVEVAWSLSQRPGGAAMGATAANHLRSMDGSGVDLAFLYPTSASFLLRIDGMAPARAAAFAHAYNSWLRDFCQPDPARLRGVGVLSLHEPSGMVAELERVAGFGWKAVVLPPNPVGHRTLSHPDYEPFWSACERLSMAVTLHEGSHARLPTAGADRFHTRFALNASSHPLEQMLALLTLIEGGVLERHPRLRVGILEAGCGWLPYWLWRMDATWQYMAGEVAENVRMKPSEYFRRQCFASIEPEEPGIAEVVRFLGTDNLMFGSDYPHADHGEDIVDHLMKLRAVLSEEAIHKLLWDNAARFYGMT
ncbi:amidohydrolase family protein [Stigmatella erecta]|uniref:Predicted metal-dependent hydrolase, TIM-barrel fold n=1 Tax=Stigmatella erecta TaxID=83460 RepID=A0A1I0HTR4_9BACT|nr:amidohydrolase family protein [Stigmatella erecta]SET87612.1 Predicted metal-dependent hydrolase, TIM-barrel fold [Stigmatella erecta]